MQREIVLAPFDRSHIEQTFIWVKNPELRHLFLMRGEVTWQKHQDYFKRVLSDPTQKVFAIVANHDHVGNCGFKNIDVSRREAELWIYIGDASMRNAGIGKEASRSLIDYGFDQLDLNSIYLHVAEYNIHARELYRKCGFHEMNHHDKTGEWTDRGCTIVRMEVTKKIWMLQ